MGKRSNSGIHTTIMSLLLFLWSSCSTEDQLFQNPAYVQARFNLHSPSALDGRITISEVYLKLDRIQAIGNGKTHTNITHPITAEEPPFQLSKTDSSQVKFRFPGRTYEALDFHLFLIADPYQLIFRESAADGPNPQDGNEGDDSDDGDPTGGGNTGGDVEGPAGDGDTTDGGKNTPPATDAEQDDSDGSPDDDGDRDEGEDDSDGGHENDRGEQDDDDDDNDRGEEDDDEDDGDGEQKDKKKKKNKGDNDRDHDKDGDDDGDDDGRKSSQKGTIPDLDHFFQNARPGILITGTYENNGRSISIIFVSSGLEKISVRASLNDAPNIRLEEYNNAEITFDAASWLQAIGPEDIESAHIHKYQQQSILFIHKDFNHQLYQILAPRLETSTTLTIHAREDGIF